MTLYYVKVTGNTVTDRAVFSDPMPTEWPDYTSWYQNDEAQIGWTYDGEFHPPPVARVVPTDYPIMGGTIRELITSGG
jgi:hypothetical protein